MGRNTKEEEKKLKAMDARREEAANRAASEAVVERSFGMRKEPGKTWEFVTYHTQNGKVIKTEVQECMDKDHAIEVYKLAFVHTFIQGR